MNERDRNALELAEYRDEACERLRALCGSRNDAPNWADIATLVRERDELHSRLRGVAQKVPDTLSVREAAVEVWAAVERTDDHTQWFAALAQLKSALDGNPAQGVGHDGDPVAWRAKNDFGHWGSTTNRALAETWRDVERLHVEPLYASPAQRPKVPDTDCEMAFIEACDEAGCAYDNEVLLKAIADLKRALPAPSWQPIYSAPQDRTFLGMQWCGSMEDSAHWVLLFEHNAFRCAETGKAIICCTHWIDLPAFGPSLTSTEGK